MTTFLGSSSFIINHQIGPQIRSRASAMAGSRAVPKVASTTLRRSKRRRVARFPPSSQHQPQLMSRETNCPDDRDDSHNSPDSDREGDSHNSDSKSWLAASSDGSSESFADPSPPINTRRKRRTTSGDVQQSLHPQMEMNLRQTKWTFSEEEMVYIRSNLLDWYVDHHRSLPWRSHPRYRKNGLPPEPLRPPNSQSSAGAPYAVWVSEIMCQQTRVSVVVDYFNRWMREFPTVQHLADSSLDRVNELWSGLGYYRRARFLHEAAKQIVNEYRGTLPSDKETLLKIKGIGKYTAGAISSIAFGNSAAAVDGNVERVFSRLLPSLTTSSRKDKSPLSQVWSLATDCVNNVESPGDFNQALMELGATVCKPRNVQCLSCPLKSVCGAFSEALDLGIQDPSSHVTKYPLKDTRKRTKVRKESVLVLVPLVQMDEQMSFLTMQRPKHGLLANLWEAPNRVVSSTGASSHKSLLQELMQTVGECLELPGEQLVEVGAAEERCVKVSRIVHIFSHIHQTLDVRLVVLNERAAPYIRIAGKTSKSGIAFSWNSESGLAKRALSTQMRKVFASAVAHINRDSKGN